MCALKFNNFSRSHYNISLIYQALWTFSLHKFLFFPLSHLLSLRQFSQILNSIISQTHCLPIIIIKKMPIDIKNVLVCDAVDQSCVDLLKNNGISVDYKLKLPKESLIEEVKVRMQCTYMCVDVVSECTFFHAVVCIWHCI